jgi:hypothetical protein
MHGHRLKRPALNELAAGLNRVPKILDEFEKAAGPGLLLPLDAHLELVHRRGKQLMGLPRVSRFLDQAAEVVARVSHYWSYSRSRTTVPFFFGGGAASV